MAGILQKKVNLPPVVVKTQYELLKKIFIMNCRKCKKLDSKWAVVCKKDCIYCRNV